MYTKTQLYDNFYTINITLNSACLIIIDHTSLVFIGHREQYISINVVGTYKNRYPGHVGMRRPTIEIHLHLHYTPINIYVHRESIEKIKKNLLGP